MNYTYKESYFYVREFNVPENYFHLKGDLAVKQNTLERGITIYEKDSGNYHCSLLVKEHGKLKGSFPFFIDEKDELRLHYDIIEVDINDLTEYTNLEPDSFLKAAKWMDEPKGSIEKKVLSIDYIPRLLSLTMPLFALAHKDTPKFEEDHDNDEVYEEDYDEVYHKIVENIELLKSMDDESLFEVYELTQKLIG